MSTSLARIPTIGPLEEIIGEAGRQLYRAGAATMRIKHGGSTVHALSRDQCKLAEIVFGALSWLSQVEVVYNARLLDELGSFYGRTFRLLDAEAQTFGFRVYIGDAESESTEQFATLIHELVHVKQYLEHGNSLSNFGYHYFKGWAENGFVYSEIPMEESAIDLEEKFLEVAELYDTQLGRSVDVPGFGHYWRLHQRGWPIEDIKTNMRASFEYRYLNEIKGFPDVMTPGRVITNGYSVISSFGGRYSLSLSSYGNLELKDGSNRIWSTGTGELHVVELTLTKSGNLTISAKGSIIWESKTRGANTTLVLQEDGNLVLYDNTLGKPYYDQKKALWSSGTDR